MLVESKGVGRLTRGVGGGGRSEVYQGGGKKKREIGGGLSQTPLNQQRAEPSKTGSKAGYQQPEQQK